MLQYNALYYTCDSIIKILYNAPSHRLMYSELNMGIETAFANEFRSALTQLITDKIIKPDPHPYYILLGDGVLLHNNGGYKNKFQVENLKEEIKESFRKLELNSIQSVIDTNKSIESLNKKTEIFYTKQTGFNKWQKWLAIAIALFTLAQVLIAAFKKDSKTEIIQIPHIKEVEYNLNKLIQETKERASRDSLFHLQVKDSLNMK